MPVFETYASRVAQAARAGEPDVYIYDYLPSFLSEQIVQIFTACIGPGWKVSCNQISTSPPNANKEWGAIAKIMRREVQSFLKRCPMNADMLMDAALATSDPLLTLMAFSAS